MVDTHMIARDVKVGVIVDFIYTGLVVCVKQIEEDNDVIITILYTDDLVSSVRYKNNSETFLTQLYEQ